LFFTVERLNASIGRKTDFIEVSIVGLYEMNFEIVFATLVSRVVCSEKK